MRRLPHDSEDLSQSNCRHAISAQRGVSIVRIVGRSAWLAMTCFAVSSLSCNSTKEPMQALTVVISGDTAGWIVPCGCTSNQSGGLARRGTFVRSLRNTQEVVVADVGGAAVGISPYDRAKFEAILAGEKRMGSVAHNIGTAEAKFGIEALHEWAYRLHAPFVSCNVADSSGRLVADAYRIVTVAGRRIAFVGVLSESPSLTNMKIESPRSAVLSLLPKLTGKFDHLIILAYLPEQELRSFAAAFPEADAVIGGPTGQSIAPERTGPTLLAAATNKGKFVISLQVARNERSWQGSVHELTDQISDDEEQKENVAAFHQLLATRDFKASETSFAKLNASDFPDHVRIVGSDRCVDCHSAACDVWRMSKHASAWQSLVKTGSQVDADCQQCHTTGYGLPGGFQSTADSRQRVSVGCEDCHGPGSLHAADPKVHTSFYHRAQYHCDRCHDRENSPKFTYETYWPLISHQGESP